MEGGQQLRGVAALLAVLAEGGKPGEGELVKSLRSPGCPGRLVEELANCRWVLGCRRVLPLMLRHPACPRQFAWEALPRLGWHDLLELSRDPRTSPLILRQAERKLLDRLPQLTMGERRALARRASRTVLVAMLGDEAPTCVEALLDNPQFREGDALRLLHDNRNPECVLTLLRHRFWGLAPAVVRAAVRCSIVPLPVALGLAVSLSKGELAILARSDEVRSALRAAAERLLNRR